MFFALATYLVINICNPLLFLRHLRGEFRWIANGLVPLTGILVTGYFMDNGFFHVLWQASFKTGKSVVLTALVLLAVIAVTGWAAGSRRLWTGSESRREGQVVNCYRVWAASAARVESRAGRPARWQQPLGGALPSRLRRQSRRERKRRRSARPAWHR